MRDVRAGAYGAAGRLLIGLLCAAIAGALGGCGSLPTQVFAPPPVDLSSPVAKEVEAASRANRPYPTFRQIPKTPTDIRPTTAWTRNIYDTLRLRRQMQALAALNPQTLQNTDAWSRANRAKAAAPPTPAAQADASNQFASDLRARATPPSPPQ